MPPWNAAITGGAMLFDYPRYGPALRWLAIPPVALVAAFIAFNFVTPFRLMQEGLWSSDGGLWAEAGMLTVDALLMLAPLVVVVVLAVWLTAPHAKIRTVQIAAGLITAVCAVFALLQLGVGNWHGGLVLVFGAVAAALTGILIVRYERSEAAMQQARDRDAESAAQAAAVESSGDDRGTPHGRD